MKEIHPRQKRAIIVGATSGMGRELAKLLMEAGYLTGITGRRGWLLEELKVEKPDACFAAVTDVSNPAATIEALEALLARLGGMDLFVISAGAGDLNPGLSFQTELETIHTNVTGFTSLADWAFNHFQQQGYGHLAGITSVGGLRGGRMAPAYNASKAYQINYLEGLAQKAGRSGHNIHVTDIRPGLVATAMAKGEGLFWVMPVERAAKQMLAAIKKRKKVAYITRRWRLIALLSRLMPRSLHQKL